MVNLTGTNNRLRKKSHWAPASHALLDVGFQGIILTWFSRRGIRAKAFSGTPPVRWSIRGDTAIGALWREDGLARRRPETEAVGVPYGVGRGGRRLPFRRRVSSSWNEGWLLRHAIHDDRALPRYERNRRRRFDAHNCSFAPQRPQPMEVFRIGRGSSATSPGPNLTPRTRHSTITSLLTTLTTEKSVFPSDGRTLASLGAQRRQAMWSKQSKPTLCRQGCAPQLSAWAARDLGTVIIQDQIVSLTAPAHGSRSYRGSHSFSAYRGV
jgi:hypothetical protein